MFKQKLFLSITFFFLLIIIYFILQLDFSIVSKNSILINISDVHELTINQKSLPDDYHIYLDSLNNLKPVSYQPDYHDLFGLDEPETDSIGIIFNDNSILTVFLGNKIDENEGVYIRFSDSDTVYECSKEIINIVNEKPDPFREYSLFGSITLNSVIAMNIQSSESNLYAIEDSYAVWTDQISGEKLNRSKVHNVINRLLNLRARLSTEVFDQIEFYYLVQLESSNGETFSINISDQKDVYVISSNKGTLFSIAKKELEFLGFQLGDFQ